MGDIMADPLTFRITVAFSVVMVAVALIAASRKDQVEEFSSILTSLGILGTFVGIVLALFAFDAADIESSVPPLLSGMKTAFITSVVGVGLAVSLRTWTVLTAARGAEDVGGRDADDIYRVLVAQGESLKALHSAIAGQEEGSMTGQLRLLRQDTVDQSKQVRDCIAKGHEGLRGSVDTASRNIQGKLEQFGEQLAKANTEALLDALNQLIRDFDAKINEQLGSAFHAFAAAVRDLGAWQAEYKRQLEDAIAGVQSVAAGVSGVDDKLGAIGQKAGAMVDVAAAMDLTLETANQRMQELDRRLAAFADLADRAGSAFPVIHQNIEQLTQGFARQVQQSAARLETSAEAQHAAVSATIDASKQSAAHAEAAVKSMEQTVATLSSRLVDLSAQHQAHLDDLTRSQAGALDNLTRQQTARIEQAVQDFDRMLGEELQNCLTSLGKNLTALSGKFVEDYQPLTESLRDVVRLSDSLRARA